MVYHRISGRPVIRPILHSSVRAGNLLRRVGGIGLRAFAQATSAFAGLFSKFVCSICSLARIGWLRSVKIFFRSCSGRTLSEGKGCVRRSTVSNARNRHLARSAAVTSTSYNSRPTKLAEVASPARWSGFSCGTAVSRGGQHLCT